MVRKSRRSESPKHSQSLNGEELAKSVKQLVDEAIEVWKANYDQEVDTLKAELSELKNSQEFICSQYDVLKEEYDKLVLTNKNQEAEICKLKSESSDMKKQSIKEMDKLDEVEQYGRRQNLEIVGVPVQENEDTNALVIEVAKLLDVEVPPDQISTSHRLPINPNSKISKTPPIIVRFVNRDIRNKLYANRKLTRSANLNKFSVAGTEKIYLNENLTQIRKKLFWKTKQKAKQMNYRYIWTTNGNIFAKKSDDEITLAIKNDLDLNLIK